MCSGCQPKVPRLAMGEEGFWSGALVLVAEERVNIRIQAEKLQGHLLLCGGRTPEKVWSSEWQDLSISTQAPECSQGPLLACSLRPLSVSSPSRPFLGESGGAQLRKGRGAEGGSLLQFPLPLWSSSLLRRQLDTLGRAGRGDSWC